MILSEKQYNAQPQNFLVDRMLNLVTSFNVKAYQDDDRVTVSLDEGVIRALDMILFERNVYRTSPCNSIEYSRLKNKAVYIFDYY